MSVNLYSLSIFISSMNVVAVLAFIINHCCQSTHWPCGYALKQPQVKY